MAINLATQYPGRVTAADANYTYGSSKNETAPGAGDGTPYELARANDIFGLQQALLRAASIVPNGNAETQLVSEYMQAIVELAAGRAVNYDESGIADVYVADVRANQQGPRSYFDGLEVEFTPGNANTGASSINVNGLGVKNIFFSGSALVGGELLTTKKYTIVFDSANDRWSLFDVSITAFTPASKIYLAQNEPITNLFNVSGLIGGAFESLGPTGSGATNIWTALDNLPEGITGVIVRVFNRVSGDTIGDFYRSRISARKTGSGVANANSNIVSDLGFYNTGGANSQVDATTEVSLPVDTLKRFDLRLTEAGTGVIGIADMVLVGVLL